MQPSLGSYDPKLGFYQIFYHRFFLMKGEGDLRSVVWDRAHRRGGEGRRPSRGLNPQAPDASGLNPPAFLNQVFGSKIASPQFTTNVEYEIDHISETDDNNPFQNIAHLFFFI